MGNITLPDAAGVTRIIELTEVRGGNHAPTASPAVR